uniref:Uncharacterized protein n=1 Tax=Onchocerca volvulus TaxID=6282 RepID=A0A8R1XR03_ONCVO
MHSSSSTLPKAACTMFNNVDLFIAQIIDVHFVKYCTSAFMLLIATIYKSLLVLILEFPRNMPKLSFNMLPSKVALP